MNHETITLLDGTVVSCEFIHYFEAGYDYGQVVRTEDGQIHHSSRSDQELSGYEEHNRLSAFAPGNAGGIKNV